MNLRIAKKILHLSNIDKVLYPYLYNEETKQFIIPDYLDLPIIKKAIKVYNKHFKHELG